MYYVSFSEYVYEISPPDDSDELYSDQGSYGLNVTINSIRRSKISGRYVELLEDDVYGYDDVASGEVGSRSCG